MKSPDEIKKGLKLCGRGCYSGCPYNSFECVEEMSRDALTYIQQIENQLHEATKRVDQLEAAQPKWISVDERLPDNRGNFITKIHCDNGDWIEVNTFDHTEKEWWHDAGNRTVEATEFVTHWMPIPDQQKEDA